MQRPRTSTRGGSAEAPAFVWRKGVHLAQTSVWCDARRAQAVCFLSHAATGRQPAHQQLIATPTTLALLGGREVLGAGHLSAPYRKRFTLGTLQLELVPNGHGFGTAALYATLLTRRTLYLGRPRMLGNSWGEQAEVRPVDAMCIDVGSGLVEEASLPIGEVMARLAEALARAAAADVVVTCATALIAYEVAHGLAALGIAVTLHKPLRRDAGLVLAANATGTRALIRLATRAQVQDKRPRFFVGDASVPWRWPEGLTRRELNELIERARPRELYLTGVGATRAAAILAGSTPARVLAPPQQMSLFS